MTQLRVRAAASPGPGQQAPLLPVPAPVPLENAPSGPLIRSRERVAAHGEVFTPPHLVEAMLDLVKPETERIDARFLEPACGSGNFLVAILRRKLAAVDVKYRRQPFQRRQFSLLGLMCLYGIELLEDNARECRQNLLELFADHLALAEGDELYRAAAYVLTQNIIHGDALKMRACDGSHLIIPEWGALGRGKFKRRDFRLESLTQARRYEEEARFFGPQPKHEVFTPVRDYPPLSIRDLAKLAPQGNDE